MTYAVEQDLIDRFGDAELIELTDRADPPAGARDSTVIAKALADADETVNAYVARRYDVPLSAVPASLTRIAADIARYYLYKDDPTEQVAAAYKDALKFLRDVADGKAVLDAAGVEPDSSGADIQVTSRDRVFSRDTTEGF